MNAHRSSLGTGILAFAAGMVVWALWGKKIKERVNQSRAWQEIKSEVEAEALRTKGLTQDAYNRIVDEVTNRYQRVKGISNHEMKDLVSDLRIHWLRIKDAWSRDVSGLDSDVTRY